MNAAVLKKYDNNASVEVEDIPIPEIGEMMF